MARRTNLTLLAALGASFCTGVLALWMGAARVAPVVWLHGAAGFAVLMLIRFKLPVTRRGLRRRRPDMGAAVATGAIALVMLGAGIAHSAGVRSAGPLTALGLHILLAVSLVPLVLLHVARRPQPPRRGDLTRAGFLRLAGLAVGAAAAKLAFDGWLGATRASSGSLRQARPAPTSWLNDSPPHLDPGTWRERMAKLPRRHVTCSLDCTSGWYAVNTWSGVAVRDLLGPLPQGTRSIEVRSATGYSRRFDVADLDRLLLADELDGRLLATGNGAPARLVVPGRRGFWWVKWVVSIQPSVRPGWWQLPFPID